MVSESSGGPAPLDVKSEVTPAQDENGWEYSLCVSTYLEQHARDFANPTLGVDHDWLHLEARYNYEALKTGSLWFGRKFTAGDELEIEVTPMVGGVFGDSTGIAPGYNISLGYKALAFFTQGEYLFDTANQTNNFFYTWSELSCNLTNWLKAGIVIDRTKVLGSNFDVRRGPLLGFKCTDHLDFTTYWLNPGGREATFVFATTVNF
jgi:hypothetical protein